MTKLFYITKIFFRIKVIQLWFIKFIAFIKCGLKTYLSARLKFFFLFFCSSFATFFMRMFPEKKKKIKISSQNKF